MFSLLGRITIATLVIAGFISIIAVWLLLNSVEKVTVPEYSTSLASLPSVSANSWLIFDIESGQVIKSHNENEVLPIASLTKLATAKVFADTENLFATTTIMWSDLKTYGRAGNLSYQDEYTFHTLLFPLLLESSNDASTVLQRGSSDLLNSMNDYTTSLGLSQTQFSDTSGLSAENKSTADELKTLFLDIYKNNRHLIDITSLSQYLIPGHAWSNVNPVSSDEDYVGGKHGYTIEANRTLIASFDELLSNNQPRRVGYILLGSDNLESDIDKLRDFVNQHVLYQ